jgi:hypothetical protein
MICRDLRARTWKVVEETGEYWYRKRGLIMVHRQYIEKAADKVQGK